MTRRKKGLAAPTPRVQFDSIKYGPELLIDVEAIGDIPTFILDRPHALNFYDITLVTKGAGTLTLDGARYPVRAGTLVFTTPGQVRSWQVSTLDGLCVFFPTLFLAEFFSDPLFLQRLPFFHTREGRAAVQLPARAARACHRRLTSMRKELRALSADSAHLLRASLYETLVTLTRIYLEIHDSSGRRVPHPVTSRYVAMVARDATVRHAVREYTRDLAVSAGYLNSLCLRYLGQNAKAVISTQLTIEARRMLLYSDLSVAQIGASLGFRDPSYFTRFFVAHTGRSPRRFRQELRQP